MTNMNNRYPFAAFLFFAHIIIGVINDAISKKLGSNIPSYEIVFLRFAFSALSLLPILLLNKSYKTKHLSLHITRGLLLFSGITIWCICLQHVPMITTSLIGFTIPIFFLILAYFFLDEKIGKRWIISVIGFVGVIVALDVHNINFNPKSLLLIIGALSFAGLDIINKKYISKESTINMLFYSSFFTAIFSFGAVLYYGWVSPSLEQIILCMVLGIGANLLLWALLKSFSYADASALLPLRYSELIIAALFGYLFFEELPTKSIYWGALIIIPCNIFLIYIENKKNKSIAK